MTENAVDRAQALPAFDADRYAVGTAAHRITQVAVVLPAHNERDRIGRALRALLAACAAAQSSGVCASILVVDDRSTDRTHEVCTTMGVEMVRADCGSAGAARRFGFDLLLARLGSHPDLVLASTDADTVVPLDWLERHLHHHRRGAPAIAGVVELDAEGIDVRHAWAAEYQASFVGSDHAHVHAANLSVRADVYRAVGGFSALERAEDIELWDRIRGCGLDPVADNALVVVTSARRVGRVRRGFAAALSELFGPTSPAVSSGR